MTPSDEPIRDLLAAYQGAVHAKDVDAFAALYDEEVRVFDLWGSWSCEGLATWRAMAAQWFASLGRERVIVEADALQVHGAGDLATGHAFLTYTGVAEDGSRLRSMSNRLTWIARRRGAAWKIVHEHTSAPAAFDTLKVELQRQAGGV